MLTDTDFTEMFSVIRDTDVPESTPTQKLLADEIEKAIEYTPEKFYSLPDGLDVRGFANYLTGWLTASSSPLTIKSE